MEFKNKSIGVLAERRVKEHLNMGHGECRDARGMLGDPDLIYRFYSYGRWRTFGIEVKSFQGIRRSRVGQCILKRAQWMDLGQWCRDNDATPLLIVEIRPRGRAPLYYKLHRKDVDPRFEGKHNQFISFTVWQILDRGTKI